ncbi:MAG: DUF480 domain-containing protein [Rhodocyclaceae bacterium]|nr:DUF480 domain-containing protein [Rhodocyclaceae bacterium]
MNIELSPHEIRVLGCLIEKEVTTPEAYPLSLNALANACNQKSNRDPVLDLADEEVQAVVDGLIRKFHVAEQAGYGSRVPKYRHRFCNTEYGTLKFSPQELAIVCELFLRGPQTPGELRSRASRMAPFRDAAHAEAVLEALAAREDGPFVVRLAREPGKRECRYAHLFGGEPPPTASAAPHAAPMAEAADAAGDADRLAALEARVTALEAALDELRAHLAAPPPA